MNEVPARATFTVEEAAQMLGISRDQAYRSVKTGEIPALRFGRRIVVPRAKFLAMFGLPDEPLEGVNREASGI